MSKKIDLTGQRFGWLTVEAEVDSRNGKSRFRCRCDCGKILETYGQALRRKMTKSCGCWRKLLPSIAFRTHGMGNTPEFATWCRIKDRCLNPNSTYYKRYGGRGITVCERWISSFENFVADMGPRPGSNFSIDRIDYNDNYSPENCRWATVATQATNRSTVRIIEFNGIIDSMAGWARRTGIPYLKLRRRIMDGWPFEKVIGEAKDCAVRALIYKEG